MIKKGFTLIELLVVIAIISLLASIVLASLQDARAKARDAKRIVEIKQIQNALELYRLKNNRYPRYNPNGDPNMANYVANEAGISCWECGGGQISFVLDEYTRLRDSLSEFIRPTPCDPLSIIQPDGTTCLSPSSASIQVGIYSIIGAGYFYKSTEDGKEYKLFLLNTVEKINGIPQSLRDSFPNSISVYSSEISKRWSPFCTINPGSVIIFNIPCP